MKATKKSLSLTLIWGPTTTGKTAYSVALAEQAGVPVISLDRIQCCPDVATGSGRASVNELRGTSRIYITCRCLSHGIVSATEANELLKQHVATLSSQFEKVILEGGSVSLLKEMVLDEYWASFRWDLKYVEMASPDLYLARAQKRVEEMLSPPDEQPSLLTELVCLWAYPELHALLEDIDGYRCAIRFARRHGLLVPELPALSPSLRQELIREIATEYMQHAEWQTNEFPKIPPSWSGSLN